MRAADLFEEDVKVPCIARELRVSEKSVYLWRYAWELGGGKRRGPRATTADCTPACRPSSPPDWNKGGPRTAGRTTRCGQPHGCAR
ncbi:helix-turn-helix domain-containing protein [Streptomyces sp. NPDC005356]